ncbi:MAG: hypothetical protein WBD31_05880 [Rubripirellula sp.]
MPSNHHPLGLIACLVPAIVLSSVALLADVARGGGLVDQWGTGQSALLVVGLVCGLIGYLIHRKAAADERSAGRPYSRTIIFILAPLFLIIAIPLAAAEWLARQFPRPLNVPTAYQQVDPVLGFSLVPSRRYRIVSLAKDFDIDVLVDENGYRIIDDQETAQSLGSPDAIVFGDSHPFGFGVTSSETFPAQLAKQLDERGHSTNVINAGVPGFGPGQCLLRMRLMKDLPAQTIIVLWINPLNDLVNLSMAVDYHFPKPHPILAENGNGNQPLVFRPAGTVTNEIGFQFSETFDSLNDRFGLTQRPFWKRSKLLDRFSVVAKAPTLEKDGSLQLVDSTSPEQFLLDDTQRINDQPLIYASRCWPELTGFEDERRKIEDLATAVLSETRKLASERRWRLIALIAPEGHVHQSYASKFIKEVELASEVGTIEPGWSHQMLLRVLATNQIPLVDGNEGIHDHADELFLQNDDHTSPIGHQRLATMLADRLQELEWLSRQHSK